MDLFCHWRAVRWYAVWAHSLAFAEAAATRYTVHADRRRAPPRPFPLSIDRAGRRSSGHAFAAGARDSARLRAARERHGRSAVQADYFRTSESRGHRKAEREQEDMEPPWTEERSKEKVGRIDIRKGETRNKQCKTQTRFVLSRVTFRSCWLERAIPTLLART